ncbi:MAG: endolytic transglycosylase MltG [Pikeienuella sp.]
MKHLISNALTILIVVGALAAAAAGVGIQQFSAPGPLEEAKFVVLKRGANLTAASETLSEAGVISSPAIFRIGARYKKAGGKLKFGEYEIPAKASMEEVLDILVSGRSIQYKITFAEGLTSWEIVQVIKESDLLTGEVAEIPAEGSLAPDTYFVSRGTKRADLIARMQASQTRILETAWAGRQPDLPIKSMKEALILASIIEKETGVASERPEVAGVFTNRLRKRMRLQSDPTIIYGITNGEGPLDRPIYRSDIRKPTAYNTYVIDRLPPGPIANPGKDAIEAAVNPAETKAIYFVADGTGGHAFAETLREHERNVAAWRKIEKSRANQ